MADLRDFMTAQMRAPEASSEAPAEGGMDSIADLIVEALAHEGDASQPTADDGLVDMAEAFLDANGHKDMGRPSHAESGMSGRGMYQYIVDQAMKRGVTDSRGLKIWLADMISAANRTRIPGRGTQKLLGYLMELEREQARRSR